MEAGGLWLLPRSADPGGSGADMFWSGVRGHGCPNEIGSGAFKAPIERSAGERMNDRDGTRDPFLRSDERSQFVGKRI